jgi:hypothetical protein
LITPCSSIELSSSAEGGDCMTGTKMGRPLLSDSRVYSDPMGRRDGGASLYHDGELLDSLPLV